MKILMPATIGRNQTGAVFLGLIMIMMVFLALGGALIYMSTTSTYSRVWTGGASEAYYMAESGFRYAQTEYQNTYDTNGDGNIKDDRNRKLINWHSPDPPDSPVLFSLSDSREKFELKIFL